MVVSLSKTFGRFLSNCLENASWIAVASLDLSGKLEQQPDWRYIKIKFRALSSVG